MNTSEATTSNHFERESFLLAELAARDREIATRDERIIHLEEQITWFKQQLFGKRPERLVSHLNAEQLASEGFEIRASEANNKKTVAANERKKPNRNGEDKITLP